MLILYVGDLHFSGWSVRGRIAVGEKQVPYQERLIELDWPTRENADGVLVVGEDNPAREVQGGCACETGDLLQLDQENLLAGSPALILPRVPVLVDTDSGAVASDILAVGELLDELYPDTGTCLMGKDVRTRAGVRSVAGWAYCDLGDLVHGASYGLSLRPGEKPVMGERAREQAGWVCDTVAALLDMSGGPFLCGQFTLADIMVSIHFQQMRGWGYNISDHGVALYASRLLSRPSIGPLLATAHAPYEQIAACVPGSLAWVLRHYRYHREHALLHDWQNDRCVRLANATARDIVELGFSGAGEDEIVTAMASRYAVPAQQVRDDVQQLRRQLSPQLVGGGGSGA